MFEEVFWRVQTFAPTLSNGFAELVRVPEYDDGGEQVEPCDPEVLALGVAVSDFALPTDP